MEKTVTEANPATTHLKTRTIKPRMRLALQTAIVLLALLGANRSQANAQASAAGVRAGDLQVGVGYSGANPDYSPSRFYGPSIYASFDFREHFGVEADFHQLNTSNSTDKFYERTYEIGGRYVRHYRGYINPYAKLMIGRGVFNYYHDSANLAYNMYSFGGGVDFNVYKSVNVRGDIEAQRWPSFPANGLSPIVVTLGAAYHFR